MLSFSEGRPIAIVKGGADHNRVIFITDEPAAGAMGGGGGCCGLCTPQCEGDCCAKCSMGGEVKGGCCGGAPNSGMQELLNMISPKRLAALEKEGEISPAEVKLLRAALRGRGAASQPIGREYKVPDEGGMVQPLPNLDTSERMYIAGPTGSGKSHYIGALLQQLRRVHRNKPIIIFSDVGKDPALDKLGNVTRFTIDEELLESGKQIDVQKLADSIVIFDDIDSINPKPLREYIEKFRDALLRRGRHENITTICTSHLLTNRNETRVVLNECSHVTVFPRAGAAHAIQYLLDHYVGLDKHQIQRIKKLPSRWVTIHTHAPQHVIHQRGIYLL